MSATERHAGHELAAFAGDGTAAEMVQVMLDRFPELGDVEPKTLEQALALVLPAYGAMVQARTFGEDYHARVAAAESITTRAYTSGVLQNMAFEAEQLARAGVDPTLNTVLAGRLRQRSHREGGKR